jgi:preprotein translocase subunit YajC
MPGMILAFMLTLVSLGAVVLILLLILQAQNRAATRRHEMFTKALESGVYDKRLLGESKSGHAMLGWGIFFVAVGFGIMIALGSNPDPAVFRNGVGGSVIPLFIGIAMIVFYFIARKLSRGQEQNGMPIVLDKENGEPPSIPHQ